MPRSSCAEARTSLRTSYERIRDLGSRLLKAQETERSRIARELHDDISQQLALLTMDLDDGAVADPGEARRLATEAVGARAGDRQQRARPVAPSASGQAAAASASSPRSGASPRDVTLRDRHRIHA